MQAPAQPVSTASAAAAPAHARAKPSASVAYVEPPPGLARGDYETSPWLVGAAALALVAAVVVFFVIRHRRLTKQRSYDSVAPQSGPMSSRR